jgi:hypothetical protein
MGQFPPLLSTNSFEEYFEMANRAYKNSTLVRHSDGAATVMSNGGKDVRYRSHITFDPLSSMPTKCSVNEYEPESGAFIKNVSSGNPRYEKHKEIYRIASLEYNCPEQVNQNVSLETVGSCQFTWHQFNEEVIRFPTDDNPSFNIDDAKKFLCFDGDTEGYSK